MNRKALFLDRDGVINKEKNYIHLIKDFEFVEGIFDLLQYAQSLHYALVIITNQAGIGRGYYSEEDFHTLNDWMLKYFMDKGIYIDQVYFCPFHPTFGIGKYKMDSEFRKPAPGMIIKAKNDLLLDLKKSVPIGDKESDILAGINANLNKTILLNSDRKTFQDTKADIVLHELAEIKAYL